MTKHSKNGFRYIKELLLQYHNFTMYDAYHRLKETNIFVSSVRTDAFVINTADLEKAKEALDFNSEIGGWRVNKYDDDITLPATMYEAVENEKIEIPAYEHKVIDIENEYATDDIIEIIKENNPLMIRGVFPGTGKSYMSKNGR